MRTGPFGGGPSLSASRHPARHLSQKIAAVGFAFLVAIWNSDSATFAFAFACPVSNSAR